MATYTRDKDKSLFNMQLSEIFAKHGADKTRHVLVDYGYDEETIDTGIARLQGETQASTQNNGVTIDGVTYQPKGFAEAAQMEEYKLKQGENLSTKKAEMFGLEDVLYTMDALDEKIAEDEGFSDTVGLKNPFTTKMWGDEAGEGYAGTKAAGFSAKYNQLLGKITVEARGKLKGQGTITDVEMKMLEDAESALKSGASQEEFMKQMDVMRAGLNTRLDTMKSEYSALDPANQERPQLRTKEDAVKWLQENPDNKFASEVQSKISEGVAQDVDDAGLKLDIGQFAGEQAGGQMGDANQEKYDGVIGNVKDKMGSNPTEQYNEFISGIKGRVAKIEPVSDITTEEESKAFDTRQRLAQVAVGMGQTNPESGETEELEDGFFAMLKDMPSDVSQYGAELGKRVDARADKTGEIGQMEDVNLIQKASWTFGQGAGLGADIIGTAWLQAMKMPFSPQQEQDIKETFEEMAQGVAETKTAKGISTWWNKYKEESPEKAENAIMAANILDLALSFTGTTIAAKHTGKLASKEALKASSDAVKNAGGAVKEGVKNVGDAVGSGVAKTKNGAGDMARYGTAQMTGFENDTVKAIMDNPDMFTRSDVKELVDESLFNKLDDAMSAKLNDVGETGKVYNGIRESGEFVSIEDGFIANTLKKNFGLDIMDGKVVASTKSATRETTDINALQKFVDNWNGKTDLDANEFLNMRHDLAILAKYDAINGKTKQSSTVAKKLRNSLNEKYRSDIDGLDALDTAYNAKREELDAIKKILFTKDGEVKKSAFTEIDRIIKGKTSGAVAKRKMLEELSPGIMEDVNISRAIKDIQRSAGQKAGTYVRGTVGVGASVVTGNPAFALLSVLSSAPAITVPIIRGYSKAKGIMDATTEKLIDKMKKGFELSTKESSFVKNAVTEAAKKMAVSGKEYAKNARLGMNIMPTDTPAGIDEAIKQVGKNLEAAKKAGRTKDVKILTKELDEMQRNRPKILAQ